jgi:hydroxymethylpyrimidine kinase/phosphomethylpyrimidine kinase/thiamine-phosphate diphosphorylase
MVKLMVNMQNQPLLYPSVSGFTDVSRSFWYFPYFESAAKAGWVHGDGNCYNQYRPCYARPGDMINRAEAAALLGCAPLSSTRYVENAAQALLALGCQAVVITGGDFAEKDTSDDCALTPHAQGWLSLPRIQTRHNHGTGCVFAASAAAALARGFVSMEAIILGKMATHHALHHGYPAGKGAGPVRPRADFAQHIARLPTFTLTGHSTTATARHFAPLSTLHLGLYAVVDSAAWVQRVLAAGVKTVQLRIKKEAHHPDLQGEIRASVAAARAAGAQLFINDHWELAIAEGAYGVHLGQEDLPLADLPAIAKAGLRLGISTHC